MKPLSNFLQSMGFAMTPSKSHLVALEKVVEDKISQIELGKHVCNLERFYQQVL